jgi:hypothetical protein
MNRFALTEVARPADANSATCKIMRCLEMESQRQMTRSVGDLAAEMASMAVWRKVHDYMTGAGGTPHGSRTCRLEA